jgi:hypothetical protein
LKIEDRTMQTIHLKSHVGNDGVLNLRVPVGVAETDVDVVVVVQPCPADRTAAPNGWPPGFFEQTYGSLREPPLERGEQGEFEVREPLE